MLRNDIEKNIWMRNFTFLAILLVAVLLITASAGLFGTGIYDPFSPAKYVQESRAQDLITLVLGVPLTLLALWAMRKGKQWSFPLWTGVLSYELYVYAIYAIGGVYNTLFLGYVAAASLSIYTIIGLLSSMDKAWFQAAVSQSMPRRWIGGFFLVITIVFAAIWIGQVISSISSGIIDSGHLIFVFDLMIVLPAFAITAFKLFQKKPIGDLLAGMLLIKFDSLCIAIALGQLFRAMNAIDVESGLLTVFIPLGLTGIVFTVLYFKNLKVSFIY